MRRARDRDRDDESVVKAVRLGLKVIEDLRKYDSHEYDPLRNLLPPEKPQPKVSVTSYIIDVIEPKLEQIKILEEERRYASGEKLDECRKKMKAKIKELKNDITKTQNDINEAAEAATQALKRLGQAFATAKVPSHRDGE